jgi:hypothetical protein
LAIDTSIRSFALAATPPGIEHNKPVAVKLPFQSKIAL